jgi:hypothetical protein
VLSDLSKTLFCEVEKLSKAPHKHKLNFCTSINQIKTFLKKMPFHIEEFYGREKEFFGKAKSGFKQGNKRI